LTNSLSVAIVRKKIDQLLIQADYKFYFIKFNI